MKEFLEKLDRLKNDHKVELICVSENSVTIHFGKSYINILNDFNHSTNVENILNRIPCVTSSLFSILGKAVFEVRKDGNSLKIEIEGSHTIEIHLSPNHENVDIAIEDQGRVVL